jgi:hypothetical protein
MGEIERRHPIHRIGQQLIDRSERTYRFKRTERCPPPLAAFRQHVPHLGMCRMFRGVVGLFSFCRLQILNTRRLVRHGANADASLARNLAHRLALGLQFGDCASSAAFFASRADAVRS